MGLFKRKERSLGFGKEMDMKGKPIGSNQKGMQSYKDRSKEKRNRFGWDKKPIPTFPLHFVENRNEWIEGIDGKKGMETIGYW